jgi:hypothetical protein
MLADIRQSENQSGATLENGGQTWKLGRRPAAVALIGLLIACAGQVLLTPLDRHS